jgi:hypothetical protein
LLLPRGSKPAADQQGFAYGPSSEGGADGTDGDQPEYEEEEEEEEGGL